MKSFNVIPIVLVVLLLVCIYLMNREHNEAILKAVALSYDYGKQSQIKDNIEHGVMDKSGKWLNEFKLAGER